MQNRKHIWVENFPRINQLIRSVTSRGYKRAKGRRWGGGVRDRGPLTSILTTWIPLILTPVHTCRTEFPQTLPGNKTGFFCGELYSLFFPGDSKLINFD